MENSVKTGSPSGGVSPSLVHHIGLPSLRRKARRSLASVNTNTMFKPSSSGGSQKAR